MNICALRTVMLMVIFAVMFAAGCSRPERISMWEMKCGACHDGKTVLGGAVMMDREQLKEKYTTMDRFVHACDETPACMNILKHDKELFRTVGKEIGIPNAAK